MGQEHIMHRKFGKEDKQLVAGDRVEYINGNGKHSEGLVVAMPARIVSDSENFAPIVKNLHDTEEDDGATYVVEIISIKKIISAHFRKRIS
jgi:hypothetical protein